MKKSLLSILYTFIIGFVVYFFTLPALNLTSIAFWLFLLFLLIVFTFNYTMLNIGFTKKNYSSFKLVKYVGGFIALVFIVIFLNALIISPLFLSKKYSKRITINENGKFSEEVSEVDFSKLPLLDKDSSQKLGDRVMGEMPELVSQFFVSDLYTQINYDEKIYRVTPLEYNGFFKYLANHKDGVKGYITVNSSTGKAKLVKLNKGMKYLSSSILFEDLERVLRFKYPTKIFGEKSFELDNEGNPYWIVPTIKYTGIERLEEISGVIILDPITGKSNYYNVKDVPSWVDHVYSASLVISQLDDWGLYNNGFINSIFDQKNVVSTSDGYNYLSLGDDIYLYTGITSVASDEANIGFVLTNLRTKDTTMYKVSGAQEYSAMDSAEGQVQQMKYNATFPLLINLGGKATYLMSLKDNAGLVKMYAFVDVKDYQKVVVTDAAKGIEYAANQYLQNNGLESNKTITKDITINSIKEAIIDGNTYYYFIDIEGTKYMTSIATNKSKLPFIKEGDTITVSYVGNDHIITIKKIK